MLYKEIGKTGVKLSRLGLGAMRLPILPTRDKSSTAQECVDIKASCELIDYAVSEGINYIDTAHPYHLGLSELVVGHALSELKLRDKIYLATKLPPWPLKKETDPERIFEEQCQKLKTDYFDFYLIHNINSATLDMFEKTKSFEFVERMKKEGRIKHIGFSFHDDVNFFKKSLDLFDWEFCQIQYNFIDEHYQAGVEGLKLAAERELGVVIMEPLKGGSLARSQPDDVEALWADDKSGKPVPTPADRSLRWLFDQPEVSIVLSGMNTKQQLKENIISASHEPKSMTKEDFDKFTKAKEIYHARQKVPCTSCAYCMPCPVGIEIPAIFTLFNHAHLFSTLGNAQFMYNNIMKAKNALATNCVNCGKCLSHCPQSINIPEMLKEAHKDLFKG